MLSCYVPLNSAVLPSDLNESPECEQASFPFPDVLV